MSAVADWRELTLVASEALATARRTDRDDLAVEFKLRLEAIDLAADEVLLAKAALIAEMVEADQRAESAWEDREMMDAAAYHAPPRE